METISIETSERAQCEISQPPTLEDKEKFSKTSNGSEKKIYSLTFETDLSLITKNTPIIFYLKYLNSTQDKRKLLTNHWFLFGLMIGDSNSPQIQ